MFGLQGFGGRTKPRTFNYKPRYWDEEADEREQRKREILGDAYKQGEENYSPGSMIRENRLRRMQHSRKTHSQGKATIIRTVIFVALVVFVLYMLTSIYGKLF